MPRFAPNLWKYGQIILPFGVRVYLLSKKSEQKEKEEIYMLAKASQHSIFIFITFSPSCNYIEWIKFTCASLWIMLRILSHSKEIFFATEWEEEFRNVKLKGVDMQGVVGGGFWYYVKLSLDPHLMIILCSHFHSLIGVLNFECVCLFWWDFYGNVIAKDWG